MLKDFYGKVGIIMAISGVSASVPGVTFRQMNVQANQTGRQATEQGMEKATEDLNVSNFGTETHIGNGQTSQVSEQIRVFHKSWSKMTILRIL